LTTTTPLRGCASGFSAIVKVTGASPCPDEGVKRIQDASLPAVHVHSRATMTFVLVTPPAAETVSAGALNET
jgi:hypothetical protein